jgi:hypothetical protein
MASRSRPLRSPRQLLVDPVEGTLVAAGRSRDQQPQAVPVGPANRGQADPSPPGNPVTGGPAPGCRCDPPWPSLVVHTAEAGDIAVSPAGHAWRPGLPLPGVLLLLRGGLPRPLPGTARSPAPSPAAGRRLAS